MRGTGGLTAGSASKPLVTRSLPMSQAEYSYRKIGRVGSQDNACRKVGRVEAEVREGQGVDGYRSVEQRGEGHVQVCQDDIAGCSSVWWRQNDVHDSGGERRNGLVRSVRHDHELELRGESVALDEGDIVRSLYLRAGQRDGRLDGSRTDGGGAVCYSELSGGWHGLGFTTRRRVPPAPPMPSTT